MKKSTFPPNASRTLENTNRSARAYCARRTRPGSSTRWCRRPTSVAHSKIRRLTGDPSARSRTAAYSFSYTRGTLAAVFGRTNWKSSRSVSGDSAYATVTPEANIRKCPPSRSSTCANGRNERFVFPGPIAGVPVSSLSGRGPTRR
jgi:hypothetical protein